MLYNSFSNWNMEFQRETIVIRSTRFRVVLVKVFTPKGRIAKETEDMSAVSVRPPSPLVCLLKICIAAWDVRAVRKIITGFVLYDRKLGAIYPSDIVMTHSALVIKSFSCRHPPQDLPPRRDLLHPGHGDEAVEPRQGDLQPGLGRLHGSPAGNF